MISLIGDASSWYMKLYQDTISNGFSTPCRQGVGLELNAPLHIEIPAADNVNSAIFSVSTQRRNPLGQRMSFSLAHGIQKFLGLPESYLQKKYGILSKYIKTDEELAYSRINKYVREKLPENISKNDPWVVANAENENICSIDQLRKVVNLLNQSRTTRRAFIDFNEGFKPRCISSWHFIIRENNLNMFQNVRSNDLLVGLPHDLFAARITQVILARILNAKIGSLHHHSSIVQVYTPDCANIDGVSEFIKINKSDNFRSEVYAHLSKSPLFHDFQSALYESCSGNLTVDARLQKIRESFVLVLNKYIDGSIAIEHF